MIAPEIPKNEKQRLKNLYSYCILDSDPENDFDGITSLAAEIFQVPICVVSIVDEERQWFKSKVGLEASETPRSISFCAHAINNPKQLTVIRDARKDPRFKDNPLVVSDPHVVFYAGAPLISSEGFPLGTLCIIDMKERELSEKQLHHLSILAQQVSNLFQLRKRNNELVETVHEKAVLLKEIHHRVKNNLQIISSLLNLQINSELDHEAQDALQASRDRIIAMSLVHQQLYQSNLIDKVNFSSYLNDLVKSISKMYQGIETEVISDQIDLNMDIAVPLSLITSEVITNSFKHAFPDGSSGKVTVSVEKIQDGTMVLSITDNGKGFPVTTNWDNSSSLGFEIIKSLTEQISGKVDCQSDSLGTSFIFYIPVKRGHLEMRQTA